MLILGIHNDEDSGVSLICDNNILCAVSEERFSRTKLFHGFPKLSLEYLFNTFNILPSDVDFVVYGWHAADNPLEPYLLQYSEQLRFYSESNHDANVFKTLSLRSSVEITQNQRTRSLFEAEILKYGFNKSQLVFVNHHLSHCYGAFACSGFNEALVFSFDGRGDLESSSTYLCKSFTPPKKITSELSTVSIGFLYGQITAYLGFRPHRHEGKITGLAAYGDPNVAIDIFRRLLWFDAASGCFRSNLSLFNPFYQPIFPELSQLLSPYSREDVAAALQSHCTNLITDYISYYVSKVGYKSIDICLSGGVAANVLLNQAIYNLPCCNNLFIMPHMGDGGLPLGSALYQSAAIDNFNPIYVDSMYLGPSYEDSFIEDVLNSHDDISFYQPESLHDEISLLLSQKLIVGLFQGRMEYGPRALCNRTILANADNRSINTTLNNRLNRTEFMPFAPIIRLEDAISCFQDIEHSDRLFEFMTCTVNVTTDYASNHPAVVHLDSTCRPQIVTSDRNPLAHQILTSYKELTGKVSLVNTSFNSHEEPIVCSPKDAINSLRNGVVDILSIGSYLVSKK